MGLLEAIKAVLGTCSKKVRKEALWLISNIAANSEEDALEIIKKNIISNLVFSAKDRNCDIKKEAIWALSNLCYITTDKQMA